MPILFCKKFRLIRGLASFYSNIRPPAASISRFILYGVTILISINNVINWVWLKHDKRMNIKKWTRTLFVACVDVRCSRNFPKDGRSYSYRAAIRYSVSENQLDKVTSKIGLCDNFLGLCVFFSLHIGLFPAYTSSRANRSTQRKFYVWSWSEHSLSSYYLKLSFFTKIIVNMWHSATAHAQVFILGGLIIDWKYPRARTSKQKRGWAFIQDGIIFARVRYYGKSATSTKRPSDGCSPD